MRKGADRGPNALPALPELDEGVGGEGAGEAQWLLVNVVGGLPRGGLLAQDPLGRAPVEVLSEGGAYRLDPADGWVRKAMETRWLVPCDEKGRPLARAPVPLRLPAAFGDWYPFDDLDCFEAESRSLMDVLAFEEDDDD